MCTGVHAIYSCQCTTVRMQMPSITEVTKFEMLNIVNLKCIDYCIEIKLNNFLNFAVPNRSYYPVQKDLIH